MAVERKLKDKHYLMSILEQFSIEFRKTKTNVIPLANHKGHRNPANQSELVANTCSRHEARENVRRRAAIDFGFTSDWMRKWRDFLNQSLSVVMENQSKRELLSMVK